MHYIYSPKKHKVYCIRAARIKDSKGLDNSYDELCLEDRVPTVEDRISELNYSESETEIENAFDLNENSTVSSREPNPSIRVAISDLEDNVYDIRLHINKGDTEVESNNSTAGSPIVSKYFAQPRHVAIAKRKLEDSTTVAPKQRC
jgi:hypothetical protein